MDLNSTELNSTTQEGQITPKELDQFSEYVEPLYREMGKFVVGQTAFIQKMVLALICNGHILIEGVPGLAKTFATNILSKIIRADFSRIQFTPDLLPADLTGILVYNPSNGTFSTKKGPLFANLVLADEINRAPAKVQSALLEAMQEKQVTLGDETHKLPSPFMVIATQNPVEQEGTYPLPEAQCDRFMMKLVLSYPDRVTEISILRERSKISANETPEVLSSPEQILSLRNMVDRVYIAPEVEEYIVDLVRATRSLNKIDPALEPLVRYPVSPRGIINLALGAKGWALINNRSFVIPQDIKDIALDILRHRIVLSYEAEAENISADEILTRVIDGVKVP